MSEADPWNICKQPGQKRWAAHTVTNRKSGYQAMIGMRNYLSFGGGVNSTAMLLYLLDEGWEFETVYVDHGCDWPETRDYVRMLAERYPITILIPQVEGYENLYEYAKKYNMIPSRRVRWCTDKFKVRVVNSYVSKPCFSFIGFSTDEAHRAKVSSSNGVENRFPLLEYGISRAQCKEIIKSHGLPIPIRSGCFFCPFQRVSQWKKLRAVHPELFCSAKQLEDNQVEARKIRGKGPLYLTGKPLEFVIKANQRKIFSEDEYPPCQCGL